MPGPSYAVCYPDLHGEGGHAFLAGTGHGGQVRQDAFLEAAWTFDRIQAEVLCELYNKSTNQKFGPAKVVYLLTVLPSGRREVKQIQPLSASNREWVRHLVGQALVQGAGQKADSALKPGAPDAKSGLEGPKGGLSG